MAKFNSGFWRTQYQRTERNGLCKNILEDYKTWRTLNTGRKVAGGSSWGSITGWRQLLGMFCYTINFSCREILPILRLVLYLVCKNLQSNYILAWNNCHPQSKQQFVCLSWRFRVSCNGWLYAKASSSRSRFLWRWSIFMRQGTNMYTNCTYIHLYRLNLIAYRFKIPKENYQIQ